MVNIIDTTLENPNLLYFNEMAILKDADNIHKQHYDLLLSNFDYNAANAYIEVAISREFFELGITYFSLGKYILATKYFKKARAFNPRLVNYFIGLSYHRKAKIIEKSGNFMAAKKNYDQAITYYTVALNTDGYKPDNKILNELLSNVYNELDEKENHHTLHTKMH